MQTQKVTFYFQKHILEPLPESIRAKVAVAGGAVRDKFLDAEIKDYDIFVEDETTEKMLMEFYAKNGKVGNVNSQLANYTYKDKWIQIIRGKYWDMKTDAVIMDFDYVHCCAMVTTMGLKVHPEFFEAIATKHIRVNKLKFPLSSLERMGKYIEKGYKPCNGTLFALAKAINDMPPAVFEMTNNTTTAEALANTLFFYADGTPRFVGVD
jgi:hypothetical protein